VRPLNFHLCSRRSGWIQKVAVQASRNAVRACHYSRLLRRPCQRRRALGQRASAAAAVRSVRSRCSCSRCSTRRPPRFSTCPPSPLPAAAPTLARGAASALACAASRLRSIECVCLPASSVSAQPPIQDLGLLTLFCASTHIYYVFINCSNITALTATIYMA